MSALTVALRRACVRVVLGTALVPAVVTAQGGPFTSLTFFGDSYVDTGNIFIGTGGAIPAAPYYAGRFSNGPVWVDYFAQALGRPTDATPMFFARASSGNYALGGARTQDVPGYPVPGTATQIGSYLTRPGATPGTLTDPTGLYSLFAGGNDLRDAGALPDPVARQAAAVAAAQRVVTQAGLLAGAGAHNVLLFTLPSAGATPEAQAIPGRPAIDDVLAATFNSTLATGIAGLRTSLPGTTFFNLRLDNLFSNLLADVGTGGTRYGLTNLTTPCLGPPAGPAGAPSCAVSVFADSLHPTTRTHQLIANAAYTYVTTGVNVSAVPEPTTVVLVAGGLIVLVGVRTRSSRVVVRLLRASATGEPS